VSIPAVVLLVSAACTHGRDFAVDGGGDLVVDGGVDDVGGGAAADRPSTEALVDGIADAAADAAAGDGPPEVGLLGGPCGPGGRCAGGTCTSLPAGSRCTTACHSNYECPDDLRCEAVTDDSMYCLIGRRGTGRIGDACGDDLRGLGCASGLCVDADEEEGIPQDTCTEPCTGNEGCAVPFPVCFEYVDLCLPVLSGDLGGLCQYDGTCVEGDCIDVVELGPRCTRVCTEGEDCGRSYLECRDSGEAWYCLVRAAGA
jgi:hypothetical protein